MSIILVGIWGLFLLECCEKNYLNVNKVWLIFGKRNKFVYDNIFEKNFWIM